MTTSSPTDIALAIPASLKPSFVPLLRLADEIDHQSPRVAYFCRFYALEKAHKYDPTSTKYPGMRQFKINLLQRLERDNATSLARRVEKTDALEIESFYSRHFENHVRIRKLRQLDRENFRAQILKAHQTAALLFEVHCVVKSRELVEVSPEVIAAVRPVEEKNEISVVSNDLPPTQDDAGASQTTIQFQKEDHSKKRYEEKETGWSGKMLKLLKDLLKFKHLKAWVGWLFRCR